MLIKEINENHLILDGATGSMLLALGLDIGTHPEELNITNADAIINIQKQYVAAGTDMVLACTFGANSKKLATSKYSLEEIISSALANSKKVGAKYIGLDIGPIGELLSPLGTLSFDAAYEIFKEVMVLGEQYGADAIYIETITDLQEMRAAILAAKENTNLPIFATMSFEANHRTFLGVTPAAMATTLTALGVNALGINCSLGPVELLPIAEELSKYTDLPLIIKPNAGLPLASSDGSITYNIDAQTFGQVMKKYQDLGFNIFGGCCGTTPEYISELRKNISNTPRLTAKSITHGLCSYSTFLPLIDSINDVYSIGERLNPTGKKRLKQALETGDMSFIISEAISQVDAGADILDINVGAPNVDEIKMMRRIVEELQGVITTPLQIDSTNPEVIEAGLRYFNGVGIINSITGEMSSMEKILPLVQKYGAYVVGLTLDENGIPATAEGRLAIAEKIVNECAKFGINKERIIIDPLTLTISTDSNNAKETLRAIELIKEALGVYCVLGVSNISFGLPNREAINSHFLALALKKGLNFPILNPNSQAMMSIINTHKLLIGEDINGYIERQSEVQAIAVIDTKAEISLNEAIQKGLEEDTRKLTIDLLKVTSPIEVIEQHLVPALDEVGQLYEVGKFFLPQLIRSAETAKVGFDEIKKFLNSQNVDVIAGKKILLATVKGDVHDIGKNIVKTILENYGLQVIDLGKDVSPEEILAKAIDEMPDFIGLAALMTTTLGNMERTIELLKENGYSGKIIVGGAVLTDDYALTIGADYYAKDAKACADIVK